MNWFSVRPRLWNSNLVANSTQKNPHVVKETHHTALSMGWPVPSSPDSIQPHTPNSFKKAQNLSKKTTYFSPPTHLHHPLTRFHFLFFCSFALAKHHPILYIYFFTISWYESGMFEAVSMISRTIIMVKFQFSLTTKRSLKRNQKPLCCPPPVFVN